MELEQIKGIVPPMCTPMLPDGTLDVQSARQLATFLVEGGVHGVFVLGSTGEFGALTTEERQTLVAQTVDVVAGRVPVYAGAITTGTRLAVEEALMLKDAGADVLVITPPIYFPVSQAEVIEMCRAVYAATQLPMMAYDIPIRTGTKFAAETLKTLAEEGVLAGVKDSSGNVDGFRTLLATVKDIPFRVFTGSELLVDTTLHMGGHGAVAGFGNCFPAEYAQVYDYACAGDWAAAAVLQNELLRRFWIVIGQGTPRQSFTAAALSGFKAVLKARKVIAHTTMGPPLCSFTAEEEAAVIKTLREQGVLDRFGD